MNVVGCQKCGTHWSWPDQAWRYAYRLLGGRLVPFQPVAGWCRQCNDVCAIEELPDFGDLVERLLRAREKLGRVVNGEAAFASGNRLISRDLWSTVQELRADVEQAQAAVDWMAIRSSGPRCLRCGSLEISPLDRVGEERSAAIHPGCGGRLAMLPSVGPDKATLRIYDIEGALMPEPGEPS